MQMGGNIGVDSVPGQGSGFHFEIPFEPAAVPVTLGQIHPLGSAPAQTLKILVAEDHPVNQRVAQLMLRSLGYEAEMVSDGLQVLQAVAQTNYDLVMLDLQMPQLDGLECARRIRSQRPGASTPWLIAVTANVVSGEQDACLAVGMNDFLPKPVTTEALRAALARCLTAVSATAV